MKIVADAQLRVDRSFLSIADTLWERRDTLLRDQTAAVRVQMPAPLNVGEGTGPLISAYIHTTLGRNVILQMWNKAQARTARLRISSIAQPGISSATTEPGQNKTTVDDSEAEGSDKEIDLD
ncbi:hypothetical protein ACFXG4_38870 [Nocardia sp. NPDC059246]|uniref:hypothetical protein n=1 Tax=unclassified Nocardia TaxID=2637762 RepID=UPI00369A8D83